MIWQIESMIAIYCSIKTLAVTRKITIVILIKIANYYADLFIPYSDLSLLSGEDTAYISAERVIWQGF